MHAPSSMRCCIWSTSWFARSISSSSSSICFKSRGSSCTEIEMCGTFAVSPTSCSCTLQINQRGQHACPSRQLVADNPRERTLRCRRRPPFRRRVPRHPSRRACRSVPSPAQVVIARQSPRRGVRRVPLSVPIAPASRSRPRRSRCRPLRSLRSRARAGRGSSGSTGSGGRARRRRAGVAGSTREPMTMSSSRGATVAMRLAERHLKDV